jgi:hypothetical protein
MYKLMMDAALREPCAKSSLSGDNQNGESRIRFNIFLVKLFCFARMQSYFLFVKIVFCFVFFKQIV